MVKQKSGARGGRPDGAGGGFRGRTTGGRGSGRSRGRGRGRSVSTQGDLDLNFTFAHLVEPFARGRGMPAFRGRGRGGLFIQRQLSADIPFPGTGRGFNIPRRRIQGIGVPKDARIMPGRPSQTLSGFFDEERPFLRPITFVPSTETRFLFQDEEELLQPIVEDVDDTVHSPVPTADRVTRVFSGSNIPPANTWANDQEGKVGVQDDLEVVDFNDFGELFQTMATTSKPKNLERSTNVVPAEKDEELITRISGRNDRVVEIVENTLPANDTRISGIAAPPLNDSHLFYVDAKPSNASNELVTPYIQQSSALLHDEDDIIVYDAPHPRNASRMSIRQTETIENFTPTTNHKQATDTTEIKFSPYKRHPVLPESASNPLFNVSIPSLAEGPLSFAPTAVKTSFITELPSFSSAADAELTRDDATTTDASTPRLRIPPITTPRQAKLWKSKLGRESKLRNGIGTFVPSRQTSFGTLGAMREEDLLRRFDGQDDRYNERRRGDSDLEWGDDGDGDIIGVEEEVVDGDMQRPELEIDADMKRVLAMLEKGKGKAGDTDNDHGMEIDVEVDIAILQRFVRGLDGPDAGAYLTKDDLECEEIIRMGDEGDDNMGQRGSSGSEDEEDDESEGAVNDEQEEAAKIEEPKVMHDGNLESLDGSDDEDLDGEEEDEEDDDLDDDENEDYENNSFQARLEYLRAKSMERNTGDVDSEDDLFERNMTLADQDEAFITHLNDIADVKDRKQLFTSIEEEYEHMNWSSSPARWRKDKYKDLPPELALQFERDRKKKAEWKELKRLASPVDLSSKKGGKKGRRDVLVAAAVDPTITVFPNRVIDMTTLVQQIRRFIADVGGPASLSLPPADKQTRENIHQVAAAFHLKSISKDKGDARYITLTKKTKTGIQVNERKIARIVRRSDYDSFILEDNKGKGKVPRHREGDVVGLTAPRLNDSNVGFRLLANMGWLEGDRIGASTNGLDAPLAAIIKTSKLGLGARKA